MSKIIERADVNEADSVDGPLVQPVLAASFSEFYELRYYSAVRLAAALVGRRDLAEELVQDAFVSLHSRWEQVSRYESPEGWLRRVVVNRSTSALRRRSTEMRLFGRLSRQREPNSEVPAPQADVWRAVADLPRRQAQVVVLMFVDNLDTAEIAAVLECNENTVRTHYRRARSALAKRLELEEEQL